ncbi:ABC transporter ATP-binding protein/permease [Sphingomonas sp. KRR8]|uniref:ABC transporter ATP-binding protein n=1 Tax=Sphingomonas sp. KRR8 TaxID=2942996 RepID=UPI0020220716|nr:ABC transporter ATP-binding protein [Sphingomonas sp. KRR8]URD61699.1 ABC transporter ATP-binding protein/permease [Sphingomonas sp. KRR8]
MATPLRTILRLISPARRREAVLLVGFMIVGAFADLVTIGALLPFLTLLSGSGAGGRWFLAAHRFSLAEAALLFAGAALVAGLLRLALTRWTLRFAAMTGHECAVEIQRRLLLQSYTFHLQQHSSSLLSALTKVEELVWRVLLPLLQGLAAIFVSGAILGTLLWVEPAIAAVTLAGFGLLYGAIALAVRARLDQASTAFDRLYDERVRLVQDSHGAIRDIILDGSAPVALEQFRRTDLTLTETQARAAAIAAAPRFLVEAIGLCLVALLAWWLSGRPGGLVAALPLLGALALGMQRMLPLLQQLYQSWVALKTSDAIAVDVLRLLSLQLTPEASDSGPLLAFTKQVDLKEVEFRYPARATPALVGISLVIRKGERIALTGRTGSGKSTLADVLMGLLEPSGGELRVDGEPIGPGQRPRWRRLIAHVPQAVFLTDDSIAANVAFGAGTAASDPERLARALQLAQLDTLVTELPDGADTPVGERGARLSGGQRQRIGLARAIYRDTPILVLDEATSALDDETEAAIVTALDRLQAEGKTIIIIAHRRSALRGCDRVVQLEGGRIVDIDEAIPAGS